MFFLPPAHDRKKEEGLKGLKQFILKMKGPDGATRETIPLSLEYLQEIIRPFPVESTFWLEDSQEHKKEPKE